MRLEEILDDEPEYKTKKQVKKQVIFTETPDATYNKHEIQACKNNSGLICYGDSYKDVLAGMLGAETIYLDIETTSCDRNKTSLNPWKNCWPCGFAIIAERFIDGVEECSLPYYIPVNKYNEQGVYDLLWKIFSHPHCKKWVNHNIKYDCHCLYNCAGIEIPEHIKIVDTLTLAKLIDSDRFRYGLDALSKDWLNIDISEYEAALKPYLQTKGSSKNKDYGLIPIDIIGPYACQDVITNRLLYKYICDNLPESCNYVRDIEIDLTRILTEIERNGLHVEIKQLQRTEMQNTFKLLEIEKRLERITKGKVFRPHCNADVYDILCNFYSLPVLKWTNSDTNNKNDKNYLTGLEEPEEYLEKDDKPCNASFDKHAIAAYLSHPVVLSNPRIKAVVKYIAMYRKINTFNNLFVKQYQELATGDLLHPFYNQCVRTGRLSCSKPNSQQLDENAKDLILPYDNIYNNINNITVEEDNNEENLFVSFDMCVVGETELITPYGNKTIIDVITNKYPVLGYYGKGYGLAFCDISAGAKIGKLPIYRVTFKDGTYIDCTKEHGFLSRYGKRINCENLQAGDRLAHIYTSRSGKYPSLKCSNDEDTLNQAIHALVGGWKYQEDIKNNPILQFKNEFHHIDENKENYHPDNIELKDRSQHRSDHAKENYKNQDHEYRVERLKEGIKNRESYIGINNPNWQGGKVTLICEWCECEFQVWPSQIHSTSGNGYKTIRKYCCNECRISAQKENHEVVSVEYIGVKEVYSITNPTTHNYISSNGIIHFNSQIEYRTITHYIESPYLIEAYNKNYDVDFHQFVADLVKEATGLDGMTRKPAKTLNFGLSFGMGKAKLLKSLEGNLDLMSSLIKEINESDIEENKKEEVFHRFAAQRAEKVFTTYHRLFPEIKQTSRKATAVCEQRGYIYNLFGRRRHLPYKFSYRAFNTVNQSSAADILKERMVYTGNLIRGSLIKLCASVHDELLFCMPKRLAEDTRVLHTIANMLENPIFPLDSDGNEKKLSVPLRVSCGVGKTWKQANKSAKVLQYDNVVTVEEFKQLIFE